MTADYYLSAYIHISEIAHLYNLPVRHDQSIALWRMEGHELYLEHYWELERLTGIKKHSRSFFCIAHFEMFLDNLLSIYNLKRTDIKEIWGIPDYGTSQLLAKIPGISYHSTAHVYSLLFSNMEMFRNSNILILSVDGGPDNLLDAKEDIQFAACYSEKGAIKKWFSISSPGPLWSISKNMFSMEEGSLMALASACRCEDKGILGIKANQLTCFEEVRVYDRRLRQLYNKIEQINFSDREMRQEYQYDEQFSEKENRISLFMKLIQKLSVEIMEDNINLILKKISKKCQDMYLGIVGGFALNCSTNSYLVKKYDFLGFYEIPCVSDTGIALGYGLGEIWIRNHDVSFQFLNSFYGNNLSLERIENNSFIKSVEPIDIKKFVEDLCLQPLIWIEGKSEIGPRALGHRSILADPRKQESKSILNKIKDREWWRPVAPIVLENELKNWFQNAYPSKFMLQTFIVLEGERQKVPAIVHLDGSARIQTINLEQNSLLYQCLKSFFDKTGVPIICNTSLNGRGQPIIDSRITALDFAIKNNLSILYIEGVRYELNIENNLGDVIVEKNIFYKFTQDMNYEEMQQKFNPYGASRDEILKLFLVFAGVEMDSKLQDKTIVKALRRLTKLQSIDLWG